MSRRTWNAITLGAVAAVACEAGLGFSLWFAPGWANGWPFGLTIYAVWSTGMAVILFLLLMTLAVCVGAAVGSVCARRGLGHRYGRSVYAAWLVAAAALALAVSWWAYRGAYAATLEMWPNGYPRGPRLGQALPGASAGRARRVSSWVDQGSARPFGRFQGSSSCSRPGG